MSAGDKPSIVARDAQQAAAVAQQAADAVNAIPGVPNKGIILHVLAGVGIVGGAVATALTAGTVPAIVAGVSAVAIYIAGWLNPTPTAVAQFGAGAK